MIEKENNLMISYQNLHRSKSEPVLLILFIIQIASMMNERTFIICFESMVVSSISTFAHNQIHCNWLGFSLCSWILKCTEADRGKQLFFSRHFFSDILSKIIPWGASGRKSKHAEFCIFVCLFLTRAPTTNLCFLNFERTPPIFHLAAGVSNLVI